MADLLRIQEQAKDKGFDNAKFFISAPKGVFEAEWVDAYFGFYRVPSVSDGFIAVNGSDQSWEGFWDKSAAEIHNEQFVPLRDLMDQIQSDQ